MYADLAKSCADAPFVTGTPFTVAILAVDVGLGIPALCALSHQETQNALGHFATGGFRDELPAYAPAMYSTVAGALGVSTLPTVRPSPQNRNVALTSALRGPDRTWQRKSVCAHVAVRDSSSRLSWARNKHRPSCSSLDPVFRNVRGGRASIMLGEHNNSRPVRRVNSIAVVALKLTTRLRLAFYPNCCDTGMRTPTLANLHARLKRFHVTREGVVES